MAVINFSDHLGLMHYKTSTQIKHFNHLGLASQFHYMCHSLKVLNKGLKARSSLSQGSTGWDFTLLARYHQP